MAERRADGLPNAPRQTAHGQLFGALDEAGRKALRST